MTDPERAALLGQAIAARNVLDGLIASLQEQQAPVCEHPEESRKYRNGTMGSDVAFTCQQCGAVVQNADSILERLVRPTNSTGD